MTDAGLSSRKQSEEGSDGKGSESEVTSSSSVEKRKYEEATNVDVGSSSDNYKKTKVSIGFSAPNKPVNPISIKLGAQKPKEPQPSLKKASATVAKMFNADDEDDEEEMPPEAKMRMRNRGRETPTSTGPNSFGKTKRGFCDTRKIFGKKSSASSDDEAEPK